MAWEPKPELQIQYKTRQTTEETNPREANGATRPAKATKATELHGAKMETMNFGVFEQRLVPGRWSHGNQLFTFRARFCFAVSALALIFGAFLPLSAASGKASVQRPSFFGGTKTKPSDGQSLGKPTRRGAARQGCGREQADKRQDERILRPRIGHDPAATARTSGH